MAIRLRLVAVVAGCLGVVGSVAAVRGQGADPAAPASRATLDQYLRRLPQLAREIRRGRIGRDRSRERPARRGGVGKSHPQAQHADDAPAGRAAPRRGGLSRARVVARDTHRPRGGRRAESGPPAAAPAESRGVRQRHPRSAGPRRRRLRAAAAGRLGLRLRQHLRRARRVAVAAGAVPLGGREDQRGRRRRSVRGPRHRHVPRAAGPVAESAHRGPAARHDGRDARAAHVPDGRRVRPAGAVLPDQLRQPARPRASACRRGDARRRPRQVRHDRRRRRPSRGLRQADGHGRRDRRAICGSRAGEGGPAHGGRQLRREPGAGRHDAAAAVPAQFGRHARLDRAAACGPRHDHRPVQRHRAWGYAGAPQNLRLQACGISPKLARNGCERRRMREADHRGARAPRVPAAGEGHRPAADPRFLQVRPPRQHVRARHRERAPADPRQPEVRVPRGAGPAECAPRRDLPHQRRRAGVAALVLPLVQHPGRRAARPRPARAG